MNPEKKEPDPNETIFGDVDLKNEPRRRIFRARLLLFCIGGIALYGMLRSLPYFEMVSFFPIVFFTGMAIWAKYNPFAALLIALIVWLGINIYAMAIDPDFMYFSVIMSVLINTLVIAMLGLGIREAWQLRKRKEV